MSSFNPLFSFLVILEKFILLVFTPPPTTSPFASQSTNKSFRVPAVWSKIDYICLVKALSIIKFEISNPISNRPSYLLNGFKQISSSNNLQF